MQGYFLTANVLSFKKLNKGPAVPRTCKEIIVNIVLKKL